MFGIFFHPQRSNDGRPVAVRVVREFASRVGATPEDAPPSVQMARDASVESNLPAKTGGRV